MSGVAAAVGLGPTSASLGLFASAGAAAAREQAITRNAKRTPTGRAAGPQVCQPPDRLRLCNPFAITPLIGVEEKCSNLFAVATAQFRKETGLKVDTNGMVLELTDPRLRQQPFIYIAEGGSMQLSPREVKNLRSNCWGEAF